MCSYSGERPWSLPILNSTGHLVILTCYKFVNCAQDIFHSILVFNCDKLFQWWPHKFLYKESFEVGGTALLCHTSTHRQIRIYSWRNRSTNFSYTSQYSARTSCHTYTGDHNIWYIILATNNIPHRSTWLVYVCTKVHYRSMAAYLHIQ